MAITLAEAAKNATDAISTAIIDEFAKSSYLLGRIPFDQSVNPAGGGSTLTYGYTRQVTQRGADFREINTEYTPTEATKQRYTVNLRPMGGAFLIDRVLNNIARGAETRFQLRELIKATRAAFQDEMINGIKEDQTDPDGFDGLSEALAGSSTEIDGSAYDWTGELDRGGAVRALRGLRALLARLDGRPDALLTNRDGLLAIQELGALTQQTQPLTGFGEVTTSWAGIPVVDLGEKAGSSDMVIPTEEDGTTDIYAVRLGEDGFHAVAVVDQPLMQVWLPDFSTAGAVKKGEVELGPAAVVLKRTKAAGVLRGVQVAAPSGS